MTDSKDSKKGKLKRNFRRMDITVSGIISKIKKENVRFVIETDQQAIYIGKDNEASLNDKEFVNQVDKIQEGILWGDISTLDDISNFIGATVLNISVENKSSASIFITDNLYQKKICMYLAFNIETDKGILRLKQTILYDHSYFRHLRQNNFVRTTTYNNYNEK